MSEKNKCSEGIISNKSWGLSTKKLTDIYRSLIRSLLEYSSILYPCFYATNIDTLEKIQFKCLKIIHRKSKFDYNIVIKSLPNYPEIVNRFDDLNINYLKKCMKNKNPIKEELFQDYTQFSKSGSLNKLTLFCKYSNRL